MPVLRHFHTKKQGFQLDWCRACRWQIAMFLNPFGFPMRRHGYECMISGRQVLSASLAGKHIPSRPMCCSLPALVVPRHQRQVDPGGHTADRAGKDTGLIRDDIGLWHHSRADRHSNSGDRRGDEEADHDAGVSRMLQRRTRSRREVLQVLLGKTMNWSVAHHMYAARCCHDPEKPLCLIR